MIQLTDANGNECWLRIDQIKAISVQSVDSRSGEKRRRTEIRMSVEKDGYVVVVLESPREIAQRMQGTGVRSVAVSPGRDTNRVIA
jgi:hypothetical protein